MKTKKPVTAWLVISILAIAVMACSLTATTPGTATSFPTATGQAAVQNTPALPTPSLGPSISHFSAGQKILITYIHMVNANIGWAIGGVSKASDHVFHSQDGGQTWHDVTPPEPAAAAGTEIQATGYFKDTTSGWVVYAPGNDALAPKSARIWYTHDGGSSWQFSSLDTSGFQESFSPSTIVFVDDQHGWILAHLGEGMNHDYIAVISTSDGGLTWHVANNPTDDTSGVQSCNKTGMAFADAQNGWLTLDCNGVDPVPHLFRTADGGATWQRLDLAAPADSPDLFNNSACGLYSPVLFSSLSSVFSLKCLDTATSKTETDYLYWTSDGGKSWQTASYPGGILVFFGKQQGFALANSIAATSDGGQTWSKRSFVTWDGQFSFIDPNRVWVVATNQGATALVESTDGCKTWTILSPVVSP